MIHPERYTCLACGREIFDGGRFCADCEKAAPYIGGDFCARCGRKTVTFTEVCDNCKNTVLNFEFARSVFTYEGIAVKMIGKFKFGGAPYMGEEFAELIADKIIGSGIACDVVTYVPMTRREKRKRGYNQSEKIAAALGKILDVEVKPLAEKVKETPRQVGLSGKARKENLEGAFAVKKRKEVRGKRVILVDDVMTTGATVNNVAARLKGAGAKSVYVFTVASAVPPRIGIL